jgi:pantothenate kinase-related protein Tda10
MNQAHIKKKIYNAFDPKESLLPDDPRYVECSEARGSVRLLSRMADTVKADKPTCQLLSGHRGCGKTTELTRLRRLLEESFYVVVYCEVDDYTDVNAQGPWYDVNPAVREAREFKP